jgi:transcriptional regulator with XRE-family HTH domain
MAGRGEERRERVVALGRAITQLRAEREMSAGQLGERAGLARAYVEAVEAADFSITCLVLWRIADGLGVPAHELVQLAHELPPDEDEAGAGSGR